MLTIHANAHSKDKDHTVMTGGTLKVDKTIESDTPIHPHVYLFTVSRNAEEIQTEWFHRGIHSVEHSFAYSFASGSIRAHYHAQAKEDWQEQRIIDISPYLVEANHFAFRITAVEELDIQKLASALETALEAMHAYLSDPAHAIPFSTSKECGQYSFHSRESALEIIDRLRRELREVHALPWTSPVTDTQWYVGDLRLLRPRPEGDMTHYTFPPLLGYRLSAVIEQMHNARHATYLQLGTFGCMTGAYTVTNDRGITDGTLLTDIQTVLQKAPTEGSAWDDAVARVVENITKYGEDR